MNNITLLERELHDLDRLDVVAATESSKLGPRTTEKDGSDHVQKRLLGKLRNELMAYGKGHRISPLLTKLMFKLLDALLLHYHKLRDLESAPKRGPQAVLKWITNQKALAENEYQWIFRPDDFVSLSAVPSLEYHCQTLLKVYPFPLDVSLLHLLNDPQKLYRVVSPGSNTTEYLYSTARIDVVTKLIAVLLAMGVMIVPIILIFWIPGNVSSLIILSSLLTFCTVMSLFTRAKAQEVLVGAAA
jgi:hypothetical protein